MKKLLMSLLVAVPLIAHADYKVLLQVANDSDPITEFRLGDGVGYTVKYDFSAGELRYVTIEGSNKPTGDIKFHWEMNLAGKGDVTLPEDKQCLQMGGEEGLNLWYKSEGAYGEGIVLPACIINMKAN